MTFKFNNDLRSCVTANLSAFDAEFPGDDQLRRAAVAIVIVPDAAGASILLTLRPARINRHAGQYALPGGRLDDGETTVEAALRELHEEMNITLTGKNVLGRLDDYPTRSGFRISPVVMWGNGITGIEPDPSEVAEVHHLPLEQLNSPDIPTLSRPNNDGRQVLSMWLPVLGHDMFAPTAAIIYQFREVALNGRPTRVAHYDQPQFAWK
ncbi:MAG: CoA pyrophosphatase [Rhizobiales bacterium]|nr:CoA pyrophosphatase [Hyphomicrobiales bacterium]